MKTRMHMRMRAPLGRNPSVPTITTLCDATCTHTFAAFSPKSCCLLAQVLLTLLGELGYDVLVEYE